MKIAVCGMSTGVDEGILKKSFEIGRLIASNGHILLAGGCGGYPLMAVKGARSVKGITKAISPAKDKEEHKNSYGFTVEDFSSIDYTGKGIPGRNFNLVDEADGVIIIGGKIGTLNEFTICFRMDKPIGVLAGSGGVTSLLPRIAEACNRNGEKDRVFYSDDAKELVSKILSLLSKK